MKKLLFTLFAAVTLVACEKPESVSPFDSPTSTITVSSDQRALSAGAVRRPSCHRPGCPLSGTGCILTKRTEEAATMRDWNAAVEGGGKGLQSFFSGSSYNGLFPALDKQDPEMFQALASGRYEGVKVDEPGFSAVYKFGRAPFNPGTCEEFKIVIE